MRIQESNRISVPPLQMEGGSGHRNLPKPLLDKWDSELKRLGAPRRALESFCALQDNETLVVVTGQQPGPWGGPLFALYKAATATFLARRLCESGHPAAAVFWIGADDVDHDEVAWGALPGVDLKLHKFRWPTGVPRSFVGNLQLDEGGPLPDGINPTGYPAAPAKDLGEGFFRFLLDALGEEGLVPLDARWPELRRAGMDLWQKAFTLENEISDSLRVHTEKLSAAGQAVPLNLETARLFVVQDGVRQSVDQGWMEQAKTTLINHPASLAPSVHYRAPLQDYLFSPWAQIVGRGEADYLKQLHPVYRILGIREPRRIPRLEATMLPKHLANREEFAEAASAPLSYIKSKAESHALQNLELVTRLRGELSTKLSGLLEGSQAWDESVNATVKKIDFQMQRLEEATRQHARRLLYRKDPRWRHFAEFVQPRRSPQDRGISAAAFTSWFKNGGEAIHTLASHHLDLLERGTHAHLLLEVQNG